MNRRIFIVSLAAVAAAPPALDKLKPVPPGFTPGWYEIVSITDANNVVVSKKDKK